MKFTGKQMRCRFFFFYITKFWVRAEETLKYLLPLHSREHFTSLQPVILDNS